MRRMILAVLSLVMIAGTVCVSAAPVSAAGPNLASVNMKLATLVTGLDQPVAIAWRGSDNTRAYVAEKSGHVRIVSGGHVVGTALTLNVSRGTEQGLLGITFSRDGTKLYADYTDINGDTHVVEWTMNGSVANTATRRQLLFQKQPFANHNGGEVMIGYDNMLYIGLGDGGGAGDPSGNGQKLSTWLGKILRIDPRPSFVGPYRIPADNPFLGQVGKKPEIWMYGLRNPWRFSIDRLSHNMWIGDVGQALYEEVDFAWVGTKGVNWGWNKREGFHPYNGGARPPGARDPLFERPHSLGDCAITGGYVYRGSQIASLAGAYVWGDFCRGKVSAVVQSNAVVTQRREFNLTVPQLSSFAEGPFGELYVLSLNGTIYRLAPA